MMYLGPPRPAFSLRSLNAETHSGLTDSLLERNQYGRALRPGIGLTQRQAANLLALGCRKGRNRLAMVGRCVERFCDQSMYCCDCQIGCREDWCEMLEGVEVGGLCAVQVRRSGLGWKTYGSGRFDRVRQQY